MYTYNPISSMQDLGIQDIQSYNLSKKKKNSLLHYALNNEKSVDIDKIKDPYAVDEEPPIIEETLGTDEDYDFIPDNTYQVEPESIDPSSALYRYRKAWS